MSRRERGNVTLLILTILVIVGMASTAVMTKLSANVSTGGTLFSRKRTFYTAESTRYVVSKLAQTYLSTVINPVSSDMQLYLNGQVPKFLPPGYVVENITVDIVSSTQFSTIPSGTFKGMFAPQTIVRVAYEVLYGAATDTSQARPKTNIEVTLSLAQVGVFQFLYFIDLNFADMSPGSLTNINGRVHANGDLCLSGAQGLKLTNITCAGRVMFGSDSRCAFQTSGDKVAVATGTDINVNQPITLSNSNGCTNCGGTALSWTSYAPATWHGNLLDSAQDVTPLSLPVPNGVSTQLGADGNDQWTGMTNAQNLRFIVDPVNATDSDDVAKQKYAYKADIRILSGVWYLRDLTNPRAWPGVPIWSDHPGTYTDYWGNKVGQSDLRARWLTWSLGTPKLFSYYEYDPVGKALTTDTNGVISYGNLAPFASGGGTRWRPGHWIDPVLGKSMCASNTLSNGGGFLDAVTGAGFNCVGANPSVGARLLNATRSGFHDGHIYKLWPNTAQAANHARVLPTNFDVQQFQTALKSVTPGELGSYFTATGLMKASFNGVIYISNVWPGYDQGYSPGDAPAMAPTQGNGFNSDAKQPAAAGPMQQQALPISLCTSAPLTGGVPKPGDAFDTDGLFHLPDCMSYSAGTIQSYPSSVRLINGSNLDPTVLPAGLSVVSSVGVYVQGEYNVNSSVASATAAPWIPALIAGDQLLFLSNNWSDGNAAWDDVTHPLYKRLATATTYNTAVITGWARSGTSMPLHAFPAMMEDWYTNIQAITFNGSIVVGFYPVYERQGRWFDGSCYTYWSGPRLINFDKHFTYTKNQPPGSPLFYVSAVLDWKTK